MIDRIYGLPLLQNNDYTQIIKGMSGLPLVQQIKIYQDIYDKEISFKEFYWTAFEKYNGRNNSPCPIHDEDISGESFAIDSVRNMWQCFGKCKTVGRAVQFELMMGQKENPAMSRLQAIKRLHKKFPNLPYPRIYETDDMKNAQDGIELNVDLDFKQGKVIELHEETEDLSLSILQAMTIEKNFERK